MYNKSQKLNQKKYVCSRGTKCVYWQEQYQNNIKAHFIKFLYCPIQGARMYLQKK